MGLRKRLRRKKRKRRAFRKRVVELTAAIKRIRRRLRRPAFVTARQLGLTFQYVWGGKGNVVHGAGHYTGGRRCPGREALIREMRAIHAQHSAQRWGGGSYEAVVADDGTIGFMNPTDRKSAAVAYHNTGLVNICVPGTTGDRITPEAQRSIRWLMRNWHTRKVPSAHRLPRHARGFVWRGHREFPSNPTACPGVMLGDYKEVWK